MVLEVDLLSSSMRIKLCETCRMCWRYSSREYPSPSASESALVRKFLIASGVPGAWYRVCRVLELALLVRRGLGRAGLALSVRLFVGYARYDGLDDHGAGARLRGVAFRGQVHQVRYVDVRNVVDIDGGGLLVGLRAKH